MSPASNRIEDTMAMTTPLPGATGLYPYLKVEWDLRESITVLAVALARKLGSNGSFSTPFDRAKFDTVVAMIGEGIKVSMVSSTWHYEGPSRHGKEATDLLSGAVEAGDLRRRPNYKYATVELLRWAATLGLDLPALLPEFGFPAKEIVDEYFQAEAARREAEMQRYREQKKQEAPVGSITNNTTIHGSVQGLNQGVGDVSQNFHNGSSAPDLQAVMAALRAVAQDPAVPEDDRKAIDVTADQLEKTSDRPALQGNWLEAAKGTLETVGAVPAAVAAMNLILAYMGASM